MTTTIGVRLAVVGAVSLCCGRPALAGQDLTHLGLEDLMGIKVFAASKYEQRQADAPAAVTVVTAEDIRTYGWRHLGDLLRAQRGMYMSYDRIYGYLGIRGILVSGDLNSRILVTVDGHRISDVVYEQAFILNDFILDTDLIERVEIVRGPGSTLHGATPLFGVINVVSRDPRRAPAHEVAVGAGSGRWRGSRYTFTKLFDNDASLMLSASGIDTHGQNLRFDTPPKWVGTTRGTDYEQVGRLFAKYESGDFKLLLAHSKRDKGIPTGATGSLFDNRENHYIDTQTALNLSYRWRLADDTNLEGRLYAGAYDFHGNLLSNDTGPVVANKDLAWGRWQGTEWKLTRRGETHTWIAGIEVQDNARQDQRNYDVGGASYLDDRRRSDRSGLYFQDEWRHSSRAALTLGLRYDLDYMDKRHLSPRLAWVFRPDADKTLKLLASRAFRAPNVAEVHYAYGTRFTANHGLKSEYIEQYEAAFEHDLSPRTRYTVNPYLLDLKQRISQVALPGGSLQYQNTGTARVVGVELEAEHRFASRDRLRASISMQRGEDGNGARLTDSPDKILILNVSRPLLDERLRLGLEFQYVGPRLTFKGSSTGASRLLNLNLGGRLQKRGPEWSIALHNALDHKYSTPDTPDPVLTNRDRIEQDGRQWRASLSIPF